MPWQTPAVRTDNTVTKALQGEVAIVSPSKGAGFDTVQAAIDAGYRHVAVAEDISENNITIPTVSLDTGFTLESIGERSTITDPDNDGTPMLTVADETTDSLFVTVRNLDFKGASGTGPLLDANFHENGGTAHRWKFERVRGNGTGPLILLGVDEPHIHDCAVQTSTSATITFNASNYTVGAGLVLKGENVDLRGGDYGNVSSGGEYGLLLLACSRVNQYGETDVNHADNGATATAAWGLDACTSVTLNGPVVEGPQSNAPSDIKLTDKITGNNYGAVSIFEPYTTNGNIVVDGGKDVDIYLPQGANGTLEVTGASDVTLWEGTNTWTLGGNNPQNGMIIAGSNSRVGPSGGGTMELKNGRYLVQEKGSRSNPAYHIGGSGAGFFVNGSGEVVVVDEAGNTTTIS